MPSTVLTAAGPSLGDASGSLNLLAPDGAFTCKLSRYKQT